MDDSSENALKNLCCTCLSRERKLFQLCRLADGINNLYSLLSFDAEAYKEAFYKDAASLHVCWECRAVMARISAFRQQACSVQKQLTDIADGRTNIHASSCLSTLKSTTKDSYDLVLSDLNESSDNFIDCGPASDDDDDIPLSELHSNGVIGEGNEEKKTPKTAKVKIKNKIKSSENGLLFSRYRKYFTTTHMPHKEMLDYREGRRMANTELPYKCESCLQVFKTEIDLEKHNEDFHIEKSNHTLCSICHCYISKDTLETHISSHSTIYACKLCGHTERSVNEAVNHMKENHRRKETKSCTKWRSCKDPGLRDGDVVLLKDDRLPPNHWKLGRIVNCCKASKIPIHCYVFISYEVDRAYDHQKDAFKLP